MRLSTIASVAVLGLSTAALAQVSQSPATQAPGNAANTVLANDSAPGDQTDLPAVNTTDVPAGSATAAPPPGEPTQASSAPPQG